MEFCPQKLNTKQTSLPCIRLNILKILHDEMILHFVILLETRFYNKLKRKNISFCIITTLYAVFLLI